MNKEYRIKEQKYKHGSLFIPQYRKYCNGWTDLIDRTIFFLEKADWVVACPDMEEATKVIEKDIENDIEKDRENELVEEIIHNYPLNQNKDEEEKETIL